MFSTTLPSEIFYFLLIQSGKSHLAKIARPYQQVLSSFHFFSAFVLKAYKKPVIFLSQTSCLLFFATRSAKYAAAKNAAPYSFFCRKLPVCFSSLLAQRNMPLQKTQPLIVRSINVTMPENDIVDSSTLVSIPYQQVNKCNLSLFKGGLSNWKFQSLISRSINVTLLFFNGHT